MRSRLIGIWLIITYIVMFIVCLIFSSRQNASGIIINFAMFIIVAVLFIYSIVNIFRVERIASELSKATKRIKEDFEKNGEKKLSDNSLGYYQYTFSNPILAKYYYEYTEESIRLKNTSSGAVYCDIEDYINKDIIDIAIRKNVLNLIPGIMTGLGILGTFLGLSIGLQHFNTGSASEISDSIAPLMNGIKVAFHTSIYGMVFSLVFNWVYKRKLEDSYYIVDHFVRYYNRYVVEDTQNENIIRLQTIIGELPKKIGVEMSEKVTNAIIPSVDKIIDSLDKFAANVSENQVESIQHVVDQFLLSMNDSLGENFASLGETVGKTCELQKKNNEFMESFVERMDSLSGNIIDIEKLSEKTVEDLSGYVNKIETLQGIINDNLNSVNIQIESLGEEQEKNQKYIDTLVEYEKNINDAANSFKNAISLEIGELSKISNEMNAGLKENLDTLNKCSDEFSTKLSDTMTNHLKYLEESEKKFSENIQSNLDAMIEAASKYGESLANVTESHLSDVTGATQAATNGMNTASAQLASVTEDFSIKLSDSLHRTFKIFDENLSDISKHLSGTIVEINATMDSIDKSTQKVPKVVASSYDGIEKTFTELQKKINELIDATEQMKNSVKEETEK